MKRIILFLSAVTLLSFVYEQNYSNKAVNATGEITSITLNGRGRDMTIAFENPGQRSGVFTTGMFVTDSLTGKYNVGDEIPVVYCDDCSPIAKAGRLPYIYSLTLMLLLVDLVFIIVLAVSWRNGKNAKK